MKRIIAALLVISFVFSTVTITFADENVWAELKVLDGDIGFEGVLTCGNSSKLTADSVHKYNETNTLMNKTEKLDSGDGITVDGLVPDFKDSDIGKSYRISTVLYMGMLVNGKYDGEGKIRAGITDGKEKTFAEIKSVRLGEWTEVSYIYTLTAENVGCSKFFIDRGGEGAALVYPRWFSVGRVSIAVSCGADEAESVGGEGGKWKEFSFDGFENTVENVTWMKAAEDKGFRLWHHGNSRTKTYPKDANAQPYAGYSCMQAYVPTLNMFYCFNNLLPTFTKADIGSKIKISVYFYGSHTVSENIGLQFGIAEDDEEFKDTEKVFAKHDKWNKLEREIEITEKNMNCTKIVLMLDNGDSKVLFSRVDNVRVMTENTKKASADVPVEIKIDGNPVKTAHDAKVMDGRLMLPAKETFDALDWKNILSADGREIMTEFDDIPAVFTADSDIFITGIYETPVEEYDKKGYHIEDSVKPRMSDGILYVPSTAITVALKGEVKWDAKSASCDITSKPVLIRRPVPTSTLTDNKDLYDMYYDEHHFEKIIPPEELPEGDVVVTEQEALENMKYKTGDGKYGTYKVVDVEGQPFDKAWRIDCTEIPRYDYDFQLCFPEFKGKYVPGDVMMVKFTYRCIKSSKEDSNCELRAVVEQNGLGYGKVLNTTLYGGSDWQTVYLAFVPGPTDEKTGVGYCRPCIAFGGRIQTLEVGGYSITNFKDKVKIDNFEASSSSQKAIVECYTKDLPWRNEAIERIEKYRKGDMDITVVDKNGNPIKDAEVDVSMYDHEFKFGSATVDYIINTENRYDVPTLFNSVTPYIHYFSAYFEAGRFRSRQMVNDLRKHGIRTARYHNIGFDVSTPEEMTKYHKLIGLYDGYMNDDLEMVKKGLKTIVENGAWDYGDYGDVDVVNEINEHHAFEDKFGHELVRWYADYAKKTFPKGTWINDNETNYRDKKVYDDRGIGTDFNSFSQEHHMTFRAMEIYVDSLRELNERGVRSVMTEYDMREKNEEYQTGNLRDIMLVAFSMPNVNGFYVWGHTDEGHWFGNGPLAYRRGDMSLKPAGKMYVDLVYNKWWTQEKGQTDENGKYSLRAFYGYYDITVKKGGATVTLQKKFLSKNKDNKIVVTFN